MNWLSQSPKCPARHLNLQEETRMSPQFKRAAVRVVGYGLTFAAAAVIAQPYIEKIAGRKWS